MRNRFIGIEQVKINFRNHLIQFRFKVEQNSWVSVTIYHKELCKQIQFWHQCAPVRVGMLNKHSILGQRFVNRMLFSWVFNTYTDIHFENTDSRNFKGRT